MSRSTLSSLILLAFTIQVLMVTQDTICNGESTAVALLVDPQLVAQIRSNLSQFEEDLCSANYTVIERTSDFTTPLEVRNYLSELYLQTDGKIEGVIFIGEIP
jgi:hypothetical protein